MKDKERHLTIKEMKKDGFSLGMIGFVIGMISGVFFFFNVTNYALLLLTATIILFFMALLVAVKLHGRYNQELLLKINGKKWEDYCPCSECLAQQKIGDVKE